MLDGIIFQRLAKFRGARDAHVCEPVICTLAEILCDNWAPQIPQLLCDGAHDDGDGDSSSDSDANGDDDFGLCCPQCDICPEDCP